MSLFNNGMNHWQRQWLGDRLHKKSQDSDPLKANAAPEPKVRLESMQKPKKRAKRTS
jgi:hypothetical protein